MKRGTIPLYRFLVPDEKARYDLGELAKMFLLDSEFIMDISPDGGSYDVAVPYELSKNERKRLLYAYLKNASGKELKWGILTGVRPEKLFRETADKLGYEEACRVLSGEYLVSPEKLQLLKDIYNVQKNVFTDSSPNACGVYIGIPFCPTRCLYCSFTSNVITKPAAAAYLKALFKEMDAVSAIMKAKGLYAESIYIGGGTPTALDDEDFELLMKKTSELFRCGATREFTAEAGRPETITRAKLRSVINNGAGRISINPQTMKQHTLELIGRMHTPVQIEEAFRLAKEEGVPDINADLITGLPEESPEDFKESLEKVIALEPTDITVHTLAVKKGSRLIEQDEYYSYKRAADVSEMIEESRRTLAGCGYVPYYMYRQKHMAGNFENVGYCLPGHESVYNIRIMEENQSIIAMGAGGISKVYFPSENRIERVANVSNYSIYIDRIDEMIKRKDDGLI